jgi:hypothetical protein
MKALTICQPYAELIARGHKRIENRTWPTNYRGLMYIHAGKSREWLADEYEQRDDDPRVNYGIPVAEMAFGQVIAIANLVDCVPIETGAKKHPWMDDHVHAGGPWCWILESPQRVEPFPWRGQLGLFDIEHVSRTAK